jgi:hypothetical protein
MRTKYLISDHVCEISTENVDEKSPIGRIKNSIGKLYTVFLSGRF